MIWLVTVIADSPYNLGREPCNFIRVLMFCNTNQMTALNGFMDISIILQGCCHSNGWFRISSLVVKIYKYEFKQPSNGP